ncbi:Fe-S cluster assembly protein SufD [Emcibacter nanhaiensis]|uniref:Fe-S cluster assembly protein SufD n=1 Tax=Emcibacter nanhaiensis TaxID=1505037 RepID=A0A501PLX6_9PROT|nr:Fe-S cluster assembly protein SufD [Emcibacter nanhaiensis]TPD61433.1 Fe-S cluster assembly protein SufD [Emcibacter nanhaiensis]
MTLKRYIDSPAVAGDFEDVRDKLPGPVVLADARQSAYDSFRAAGLPGPKVEEWKYSNLTKLAAGTFSVAERTDGAGAEAARFSSAARLVFVNGFFSAVRSNLADITGLTLTPLSKATQDQLAQFASLDDEDSLSALNKAMFTDGFLLDVADGVEIPGAIEIVYLAEEHADRKALRTRNLITLGEGASLELIESFRGSDGQAYWTQNISHIRLAQKAALHSYTLQQEGDKAVHMNRKTVHLADAASFENHSLQLGSEMSRTEIFPVLNGEEAGVTLKGAYLARNGQSQDIFTRMDHAKGHCQSEQVFRGVLDKGGKTAFQGKVIVEQDAQKTNADQSCKNLLLDRQAQANAKPELLIFADDVKCSHGATVGELDEMALFYLESRGLSPAEARAMLVQAFLAEVFEELDNEELREAFQSRIRDWLAASGVNS